MNTKLRENIYWVGCVDYNVRDFHGYRTERGSTYNAYLILDKKNVLVDTVKAPFAAELLKNLEEHIPADKIDYVICNHAEPDHSGALPLIMEKCSNAKLVCDAKCKAILDLYYDISNWEFELVKTGDSISLGKRSVSFLETPMVHWPESMFTYIPEEKILFSMDAFGQHYSSSKRFDYENQLPTILDEARTYYANIIMLFGRQTLKTLEAAKDLEIEIIAPSHGVIWTKHIPEILAAYKDWAVFKPKKKVLIMYATMWKSTEKMAIAIRDGANEFDVEVLLYNVDDIHKTVLATETLDSATIAIGSSTLNQGVMPEIASVLTYLKGLKPQNKSVVCFGSYGWAPATKELTSYVEAMKLDIMQDPITCKYKPTEEVFEQCREAGRNLAKKALEA
jgi:flavorubredoxin